CDAASILKVGNALKEETEMGPVVSSSARSKIIANIQEGIEQGSKTLLDGRKVTILEHPQGFYLGPTVLDNVSADMSISKKEVFGPVASVINLDSLDQAVEFINKKSDFGNMACIFTSSGKNAREFRRRVNAGNIGINIGVASPAANFPFGGRKESFYGILHAQVD